MWLSLNDSTRKDYLVYLRCNWYTDPMPFSKWVNVPSTHMLWRKAAWVFYRCPPLVSVTYTSFDVAVALTIVVPWHRHVSIWPWNVRWRIEDCPSAGQKGRIGACPLLEYETSFQKEIATWKWRRLAFWQSDCQHRRNFRSLLVYTIYFTLSWDQIYLPRAIFFGN